MFFDRKDKEVKIALWVVLVLIFSCVNMSCASQGQKVQQVLVPVSEDTYIRQKQIEAIQQRERDDYRLRVMDMYSQERSEIRRIQADIERDKRRYEAQAEEDRRDAAKDIFENFQDRRADAARDYRDMGREIAPYVYKDIRRELRRRR